MRVSQVVDKLLEQGHLFHEDGALERPKSAKLHFASALREKKHFIDPWKQYELPKRPTEICVRWDYDASTDTWSSAEALIKMEAGSFAAGAMRECYRMKKMSQENAHYFFKMDWEHCNNYVAKRYMKPDTPADIYFSDVKMQMVSKRFSKLYNAMRPPKAVDFLQAFVIEICRDGTKQYYCVERFIGGEYVKHNNNSGFLDFDGPHRATPHVFSRFSFEASKGELMVVDIQGVDDIFTDPQIHSLSGEGYGDGNLGVGGMALFFSSAVYDDLCKCVGLPQFALSPEELKRAESHKQQGLPEATMAKGCVTDTCSARATISAASADLENRKQLLKTGQLAHGQDELDASVLPLELLRKGEAAAAARRAAGIPEPPPPAPPPVDGAAHAPLAIGLVHAKLAELSMSGRLPYQEGQSDLPSAGFHLVCAAAAGEPRALRDLRALLLDLSAAEVLPGVKLVTATLEALAEELLPLLSARLAATGDVQAMLDAANAEAAADQTESAVAWMRAAAAAAQVQQEAGEALMGAVAPHKLLERLAELLVQVGDEASASEAYEAASEAANEAGNFKLGMKLADKAAQLAPADD